MKAIYGLYAHPIAAQRAFDQLKAVGVTEKRILILSSEPHEEYDFAKRDHKSYMTWIGALGGLIGMTTGYLMTSGHPEVLGDQYGRHADRYQLDEPHRHL